jgi:hypothetical protein
MVLAEVPAVSKKGVDDGYQKVGVSSAGERKAQQLYHICDMAEVTPISTYTSKKIPFFRSSYDRKRGGKFIKIDYSVIICAK